MRKLFILPVLFFLLSACGKDSNEFQYRYDINGCDTGEHNADSHAQYCTNLRNDSLNRNCAQAERRQAFEARGCGTW